MTLVETLEQYDKENAKIESLVDSIVTKLPNQKVDIFTPGFWEVFFPIEYELMDKGRANVIKEVKRKYGEEMAKKVEKNDPGAGISSNLFSIERENKAYMQAYGGSLAHMDGPQELCGRIFNKGLCNFLVDKGIIGQEKEELVYKSMNVNWAKGKYSKEVSSDVIKAVRERELEHLKALIEDPKGRNINAWINKYRIRLRYFYDCLFIDTKWEDPDDKDYANLPKEVREQIKSAYKKGWKRKFNKYVEEYGRKDTQSIHEILEQDGSNYPLGLNDIYIRSVALTNEISKYS